MTGVIATIPKFQFSSSTGVPLALGTLTVYLANTTTPTDTWQDSALSTLNTNPVQLDSSGSCVLWLDSTKSYKFVLKNATGAIQWTVDNIFGSISTASLLAIFAASSGSSLVGYLPAGTGAVATTVQAKLRESVSVLDFGAVGDGVTDDTDAFQLASAHINANSGGRLLIPGGRTYRIGRQNFAGASGLGYAYQMEPIVSINNCTRPVIIESDGAILKFADGLKFGSFDPVTGVAYIPGALPFTNAHYAADVGTALDFTFNSGGVSIVGSLELDGNNTNLVIGGQWGDTGYQRYAYGVREYNNASFHAENLYVHHHGLDGIACGYTGAVAGGPKTPKTLINVTSEFNGRQGFSWVGGNGLTAINCKFNSSGKAINTGTGVALASSPGAGLDIEAESAVCRDGVFINCDMVNNTNTALVADSGDSADVRFIGCNFAGTVWPRKPGFKFDSCKFYGQISVPYGNTDPQKATAFTDCLFTDTQFGDYLVPAALDAMLFGSALTTPVWMTRCTINATRLRPGRLDFYRLTDCKINLSFPGTTALADTSDVINFNGAVLQGNTIDANITVNPPASGYAIINVDLASTVGRNTLTNTAGIVRWTSWSAGGGGYVGLLGNTGRQEGAKTGSNALSLFPGNWFTQYYGTLDIYANTAAPVSGTYKRGDRVVNQSPAVGSPKGWICTVAGTPGTWVSEGNL